MPPEAFDLASAQAFKQTCQTYIPDFDLSKVVVANRGLGVRNEADAGAFDLLFTHPESDKFCSARIHWPLHQMEIKWGNPKTPPDQWFKKSLEIKDACLFTEKAAGSAEFDGQLCKDGAIDERMIGAEQFKSVRFFRDKCQVQLKKAYRRSGETGTPPDFDLSRVQILNPSVGDGNYSLLYQNIGLDFFCRADIDNTAHALEVSHGRLKEKDNGKFEENLVIPLMSDDCSMTRGILGEAELGNRVCKDHTERDQQVDRIYSVGGTLLGSGMFYYFMYGLGKRFAYAPLARVLGPRLAPFALGARAWLAEALPSLATRVSPTLGRLATGLFESAAVDGAAAAATNRLTVGRLFKGGLVATVLVYGLDKFFEQGVVGNDYLVSINKRASQFVYDKNVYSGWNKVNPFSWVRAASRLMAPNATSWGVVRDNPELVEKLLQKDKEDSDQAEAFLSETLPPFLKTENGMDPSKTAEMLRQAIVLSDLEKLQGELLRDQGVEALKSKYPMSDEDIEALSQKTMLKEVQEAAKFLVYAQLDQNDWARELFNSDGTLKAGVSIPHSL